MIVYLSISLALVRQKKAMATDSLLDYFFSSGETEAGNRN